MQIFLNRNAGARFMFLWTGSRGFNKTKREWGCSDHKTGERAIKGAPSTSSFGRVLWRNGLETALLIFKKSTEKTGPLSTLEITRREAEIYFLAIENLPHG